MTRKELEAIAVSIMILIARGDEDMVDEILKELTDDELHEVAKILAA